MSFRRKRVVPKEAMVVIVLSVAVRFETDEESTLQCVAIEDIVRWVRRNIEHTTIPGQTHRRQSWSQKPLSETCDHLSVRSRALKPCVTRENVGESRLRKNMGCNPKACPLS